MSIFLSTSEKTALAEHVGTKVHDSIDLRDKLQALAKFIGCRDRIPPDMLDSIIKRVTMKYREFTFNDITNAFHFYLDHMEGNKKIYELDGLTISMVLNPYWGYLQRLKAKRIGLEGESATVEAVTVKIEKNDKSEMEAFDYIDNYCSNNPTLPLGASWTWAFDYANKNGIIKRDSSDMDLREEMTKDKIKDEASRSQDPRSYKRENTTTEALETRMKTDLVQEYMKKQHGVTKHRFAL